MEIAFDIAAPAKVNLCLSVQFPPTADGYHTLDSVFQELPALADELHFAVVPIDAVADRRDCSCTAAGTLVALECEVAGLATADNLIFRAVDAMERAFGDTVVAPDEGFLIQVEKHIPAGGGLGGGSSDAAAAIKACARLMDIDPLDERALAVARSLGADVAFFMYGGCALMDKRGDTLVRKLPNFSLPIVLMGEREGISTARIYHDFDANPPAAPDAYALAAAIESFPEPATAAAKAGLARLCANNLEPAAFDALPRLRDRVQRAQEDPDTLHALVTGSGATSYAICADEGAAMRFAERAAGYCDWVCIA